MKVVDTVKKAIVEWPSLFLRKTFEESTFSVMHQMMIVLGNGNDWAYTKDPKKGGYLTHDQYRKYKGEWVRKFDLPYGKERYDVDVSRYFEEEMISARLKNQNIMKHGVGEYGKDYIYIFKSDLSKYPEYKEEYSLDNLAIAKEEYPYPSFDKNYSPFWEDGVEYIQDDWREAGLLQLNHWLAYFLDDERVKSYHYYPGRCGKENSFETYVKDRYLREGVTKEAIEAVNKAYEVTEFDGYNFDEIDQIRWNRTRKRCIEFCEETLHKLENI